MMVLRKKHKLGRVFRSFNDGALMYVKCIALKFVSSLISVNDQQHHLRHPSS
jgi:hypothetical protein